MPKNVFINEYRTNWVSEYRTNVISLYQTNRSQVFLTNRFLVEVVQTNYVTAYRTNLETLNLTNWETVLVLRTNWINRLVTNVAQIDVPVAPPASASSAISPSAGASLSIPVSSDGLILESVKPPKKVGDEEWEVCLRVRSVNEGPSPTVQRWRIERADGAILSFSQEQVLTRELTPGRYRVEARVQRQGASAIKVLRSILVVTPDAAMLQPSPGKNLASAN